MAREATVERLEEGWLLRFNNGDGTGYRRAAAATVAESLTRVADHFGYRIDSLTLTPWAAFQPAPAPPPVQVFVEQYEDPGEKEPAPPGPLEHAP